MEKIDFFLLMIYPKRHLKGNKIQNSFPSIPYTSNKNFMNYFNFIIALSEFPSSLAVQDKFWKTDLKFFYPVNFDIIILIF